MVVKKVILLEWEGRKAELGLMLWISEPGERCTFSLLFVNLKTDNLDLFFLGGAKERVLPSGAGDWGFLNWPPESSLFVRVSQLCSNLFPGKSLVMNLKLETLPYLVAEKLWKWSFRNLFQELLFEKRPCNLHFIHIKPNKAYCLHMCLAPLWMEKIFCLCCFLKE